MKIFKIAVVAFFVFVVAQQNLAHHSTANFNFDPKARVTITGKVTYWSYTNPHAFIKIDVTSDSGAIEQYTIFLTARAVLQRQGWTRESIVPGEIVEIEGSPDVNKAKELYLQRIVFANGKEWRRDSVAE